MSKRKDTPQNNVQRKRAIQKCLTDNAPDEERIVQLLNSCKRNMDKDIEFRYLGKSLWQKLMFINPAYGL